MQNRLVDFYRRSFSSFFEAIVNICIFLPYFFSVKTLLKTLFNPWRNLIVKKTQVGFTFADLFNRISFNLISRTMGFIMRISIIIFYILFQIVFLLALPFVCMLYFVLLPIIFFLFQFEKTEEQKRASLKATFIKTHTLQKENTQFVDQWFEYIYQRQYNTFKWWKLDSLLSIPPLARDWSTGFTPTLDQFSSDLCDSTYQAGLKHIVGRKKEIDQIERALSKTEEANVILIGEEGVGKSTIVDGLAKKVYEGHTTSVLMYKRVLKLDMERILTQFIDQKKREEFMEELLYEAEQAKNIILLIDNIDKYVASGSDRVDLSIPLEKYGRSHHLQIIGITTPFMYQKFILTQSKLTQLFTAVEVAEVTKDEAFQILLDTAHLFEERFNVYLPYESIKTAVEKSDFYITSIPFPEKAMKLIDDACVYTVQVIKQKTVLPEVIIGILSEQTHTPTTLSSQMKERLLQLEPLLSQRIVDQDEAVHELASALRRSFLMLGKRKKPLATFLFLGPTGVGKTETAKSIANVFFGSENSMLRFDMSMYQSKSDIPKLIGSLETQNPGLLTQAIREKPFGVLLLDEIEKADKDLLNIFLTMLDEGYFTDGNGRRVDCKNLVVIATSNAGADYIIQQAPAQANETFTKLLLDYLIENHIFSPEFLNRFDGVIAYRYLDNISVAKVAEKMLQHIAQQIYSLHGVKIAVSQQTLQAVIQKGYDPMYGARNMERILRNEIEDKVAKLILEGQAKQGDTIQL